MKKFYVSYSTTLFATRVIAAESEEEALRIAEELRYDRKFCEGLIDSFDNDYEGYAAKNFKVEVDGEADVDDLADNEEE